MDNAFLGLNNFVWWFGVVENRLDPLELGRCKVRCFGWHNSDINQIPIDDLPWAHPVVPYGVKAVQPPPEGTMVFGFFADGKIGQYPIIMGTVPGVPEELVDNNLGFTDPYTEAEKASQNFPRKIREASIRTDTRGVQVVEDVAKRNPANLNEPTISRLARPVRGVAEDGTYDGIAPESIANTTIDIQRKTRITDINTAAGTTWDEPYPSYNAQYPFNHVSETESGHAFEMDDTKEFERVQLSHRTGSTLEFLPEGHTKIKSQSGRYDVTMGDHRNYVNGTKYETVDSDYFIRVNGKLRIECDVFELVCKGNPGTATITAEQGVDVKGGTKFSASGLSSAMTGATVSINGAINTSIFGGTNASLSSGGQASMGGTLVHLGGNIVEADAQVFKTHGIQDLNSCLPPLGEVLKVPEPELIDAGTPQFSVPVIPGVTDG
jgi:hypothetical protein